MQPCKDCVYYKTPSCIGEFSRAVLVEDYDCDCFTTEEYKMMCDLLCGEMLDD